MRFNEIQLDTAALEGAIAMPIVNRIADLHGEITAWRHDLHAHPELLYDVHRTAATVADKLKASAATRW